MRELTTAESGSGEAALHLTGWSAAFCLLPHISTMKNVLLLLQKVLKRFTFRRAYGKMSSDILPIFRYYQNSGKGSDRMIVLITGASHTGKTALAQKLLETWHYPYLSIDHLKMGLIRSGNTTLTPVSPDEELTQYLWPIVREMIKTAIENHQNLIVEGCYIPVDWERGFEKEYLAQIRYYCLVMSEHYIRNHFDDIRKYAGVIEERLEDDGCTLEFVLQENAKFLERVKKHDLNYILIDNNYQPEIDLK